MPFQDRPSPGSVLIWFWGLTLLLLSRPLASQDVSNSGFDLIARRVGANGCVYLRSDDVEHRSPNLTELSGHPLSERIVIAVAPFNFDRFGSGPTLLHCRFDGPRSGHVIENGFSFAILGIVVSYLNGSPVYVFGRMRRLIIISTWTFTASTSRVFANPNVMLSTLIPSECFSTAA